MSRNKSIQQVVSMPHGTRFFYLRRGGPVREGRPDRQLVGAVAWYRESDNSIVFGVSVYNDKAEKGFDKGVARARALERMLRGQFYIPTPDGELAVESIMRALYRNAWVPQKARHAARHVLRSERLLQILEPLDPREDLDDSPCGHGLCSGCTGACSTHDTIRPPAPHEDGTGEAVDIAM